MSPVIFNYLPTNVCAGGNRQPSDLLDQGHLWERTSSQIQGVPKVAHAPGGLSRVWLSRAGVCPGTCLSFICTSPFTPSSTFPLWPSPLSPVTSARPWRHHRMRCCRCTLVSSPVHSFELTVALFEQARLAFLTGSNRISRRSFCGPRYFVSPAPLRDLGTFPPLHLDHSLSIDLDFLCFGRTL